MRQANLWGLEMKRREFIHKSIKAGMALVAGTCWLAKKAVPRKFVRAVPLRKYPGTVGPLPDAFEQSRWSG